MYDALKFEANLNDSPLQVLHNLNLSAIILYALLIQILK